MTSSSRAIQALGLTDEQYADLKRMLPARKLEAIKRYREITNFGLAEAKAAVDAIEAGAVPGGGPAVSQRPAWEAAAQQGMQAIRQPSGASLYEAKMIADLAALLPAGLRAPSREEAAEIVGLAARGAIDEAAAQLGARWGLDPTTAAEVAGRLRSGRRRPAVVFAVIAGTLAAAIAWFAWSLIRG